MDNAGPQNQAPRKVAIIGGGYAGLAATWALAKYGFDDVHIYTREFSLTGFLKHYSVNVGDRHYNVNIGLPLYKEACSPNLQLFLEKLQLPNSSRDFDFTFSTVRRSFQWYFGCCVDFALQFILNFWDPKSWLIWYHVLRFNCNALNVLHPRFQTESVRSYLRRRAYPDEFRDWYLVPLMGILWGCQNINDVMDFPIEVVVRYMWNYDLLRQPLPWWQPESWKAVTVNDYALVNKIVGLIPPQNIHCTSHVNSIALVPRIGNRRRMLLLRVNGSSQPEPFDHVILACSANAAIRLLDFDLFPKVVETLTPFERHEVFAHIHSDPKHCTGVWIFPSAFNYSSTSDGFYSGTENGVVTYSLNEVFGVASNSKDKLFYSATTGRQLDLENVYCQLLISRNRFNVDAYKALDRLQELQHIHGLSFCGSWVGFGRVEDGITSALRAAEFLGAQAFCIASYDQLNRPVPQITWWNLFWTVVLELIGIAWELTVLLHSVWRGFRVWRKS